MLEVITAPTTSDLTVLATATRELQLVRAEDTAGLADLICEASGICASWCKRPEGFGRATVRQTERLATARDCIVLERDLAPTITSVTLDGTTLASTEYELDGALLYRLVSDDVVAWPAGAKVVITYQAGFVLLTGLPTEIERACLAVIAYLHGLRGNNPAARTEDNGLTRISYQDTDGGIPMQAAGWLRPYRRVTL
jgi:hypothetical protein